MSDNGQAEHVDSTSTEEDLGVLWNNILEEIRLINPATENWKSQSLPLARVKKIMKSEEFALQEIERRTQSTQPPDQEGNGKSSNKFMISGEAPLLMTKACELLIKEVSTRAWKHTDTNRRKTLQRADLHAAVGESEVFDFLIDIVPRVISSSNNHNATGAAAAAAAAAAAVVATSVPQSLGIPSVQQFMQTHPQLQQVQQQQFQQQFHQSEQHRMLATLPNIDADTLLANPAVPSELQTFENTFHLPPQPDDRSEQQSLLTQQQAQTIPQIQRQQWEAENNDDV